MSRCLRIAAADDEPVMQEYYRDILPRLGHQVVALAGNGRELVEVCRSARPDLVITDVRMTEMDGVAAAAALCRECPVPIVLVSAYPDADRLERVQDEYILAYLVKPIEPQELQLAIVLALRRFEQFQMLRREAADLRQALADRKLIERAKGILMKKGQLDEQAAFRRLQKLARDKNKKLAEVAQVILLAEEAMQPATVC